MSNEADFTFYRYRAGDPPYRRTPEGRYEQYRDERGGWVQCNQHDRGLTRISPLFLPKQARGHAYAPAADSARDERAEVPR